MTTALFLTVIGLLFFLYLRERRNNFTHASSRIYWLTNLPYKSKDEAVLNFTYDFFISYATPDRETVARPLYEALNRLGYKVWFDAENLTVGDNLCEAISAGLSHSRFALIIFSPAYLDRAWPRRELTGFLSKESSGMKVILPIRHHISHEEIVARLPILADKISITTSPGLDRVVLEIIKATSQNENS